jgi:hypothetical protein
MRRSFPLLAVVQIFLPRFEAGLLVIVLLACFFGARLRVTGVHSLWSMTVAMQIGPLTMF